jgi:hypothetical protein
MKLRRMRWTKLAASIGKLVCAPHNFSPKKIKGKDHLENLDVDGILKCIKNKFM